MYSLEKGVTVHTERTHGGASRTAIRLQWPSDVLNMLRFRDHVVHSLAASGQHGTADRWLLACARVQHAAHRGKKPPPETTTVLKILLREFPGAA